MTCSLLLVRGCSLVSHRCEDNETVTVRTSRRANVTVHRTFDPPSSALSDAADDSEEDDHDDDDDEERERAEEEEVVLVGGVDS